MQYLVHGVDNEGVDAQLEALAESHWTYMDGFLDDLVARGPTLSPDGERHTGSIHLIRESDRDGAQRFAFDEPYWREGLYRTVSVTRFHNALAGTMWDGRRPARGSTSSLVVANWPQRAFAPDAAVDARVLRQLAAAEALVFGGLLISDDGTSSVGLAAAFDLSPERASSLVEALGLPELTTFTACCWQRGGRDQD